MSALSFRTMIVPAAYQALAASLGAAIGGASGQHMFITKLSDSGNEPATHYVSTGQIAANFASLLPLDTYITEIDPSTGKPVVIHTHYDGNPIAVTELALNAELEVTEAEIIDLFNVCDVTEENAFVAFDRLGLQLVNVPLIPSVSS